ncbi:tetratricopeptide repeat protein [Umezawaea sp. Da 62-37]|uniref:tetratricopeptide repeat protein n=1 Tax=Umezawaea sp. Da 62-37 TaxID=3075927 RepID=UPI0028F6E401|nr:tetratricopeptide repeat protein [Umezawaea sp. Da 62-37]WNV85684.1 tetratricopeptide repeat protein [Umezawaea sp. Da 62-37]
MAHDEDREALTFGEAYRRARAAAYPPFDVGRGLAGLQAWIDREVDVVAEPRRELAVPRGPRGGLRGRGGLLDELSVSAHEPGGGPVVLAGVGGAGKSTIAIAVAERLREQGRRVWWVSAASSTARSAGFAAVARELKGSPVDVKAIEDGAADAPDRFWRLLESSSGEWLLVIDNADDPAALAVGWLRSSRDGLVLVTSRTADPRAWGTARVHQVGRLRETDAAQVLCDLAPAAGDLDQARVLARRLGGLPLALHLAGTYLHSGVARWPTFADYGRAVAANGERLPRGGSDVAAVTRTAEIALEGLARGGITHARAALQLVSCYASTSIPTGVFESASVAGLYGQEAQDRLGEAMRGLDSVGLIHNWSEGSAVADGAISLHPVITLSARARIGGTDADRIRHAAVDLLATAVAELRFDLPQDWPRYRSLAPHLLALLDNVAEHVDHGHHAVLMDATTNMVRALDRSGTVKAAMALGEIARARCAVLGDDHPATLRLRHQLAWAVANQGDLAEAESQYRMILDARLRVLGGRHVDTCESRHELAWIAACRGRWAQAESRYRQAFRHSLLILGPDDPATLTTRHELAWAVASRGRLDEAFAAFLDVLRDRRRVLGEDHPQTLATRHEIAWVTAKLGGWAEAEAMYREVLGLRQRVLEEEHPEILLSTHELAWTAARQGRTAEATLLYEDVLKRRRRVLGDDHPETRTTARALEELRAGRVVDAFHIV